MFILGEQYSVCVPMLLRRNGFVVQKFSKKDAVSNEETNCNNETNETNRKYFATKIS